MAELSKRCSDFCCVEAEVTDVWFEATKSVTVPYAAVEDRHASSFHSLRDLACSWTAAPHSPVAGSGPFLREAP